MNYFRNECSKLAFRVTTLPLLSTTLCCKRVMRYRRVRSEFKLVQGDDDDGEICINNIHLYINVYTHRRVSLQRTSRGSARATSRETGEGGMEPVCNKINRGVAREDIRGGKTGMGGKGEQEEEDGRVNGPAQEEGGSRGGGSAGRKRTRKTRKKGARKRGAKEDKTTPPPATPTLWTRRRTAMECLHPPPPHPPPALPPSSSPLHPLPSLRAISSYFPSLPPTSNLYGTALANLKLGGDASPGMVRAALVAVAVKLETAWISGILFQRLRDTPFGVCGQSRPVVRGKMANVAMIPLETIFSCMSGFLYFKRRVCNATFIHY